jgi:hypothetical protein
MRFLYGEYIGLLLPQLFSISYYDHQVNSGECEWCLPVEPLKIVRLI